MKPNRKSKGSRPGAPVAAPTAPAGAVPVPAPVSSGGGRWLAVVLRCLVGVLLLWAGATKVANPVVFHGDILAYKLPLPESWTSALAVALPWVEVLCGVMLVTRTRVQGALLLALGLFVAFDLATGQAVLRGLDVDCGCFNADSLKALHLDGIASAANSVGSAFVRDLVLTGVIAWLLARSSVGEGTRAGSAV